jgi:RNA polymerase sigma-70 factor (ECF subfamily)
MSTQIGEEQITDKIHRIIAGDSELFWALVGPYQRSLYMTAYSLLHNIDDATDVVQETMLKALKSLDSLRDGTCFKGWLHTIAINEARMKMRKSREEVSWETETDEDEGFRPRDFANWKDIPSDHLERKEIRAAVERALQSLSPALREVFTLRRSTIAVPEHRIRGQRCNASGCIEHGSNARMLGPVTSQPPFSVDASADDARYAGYARPSGNTMQDCDEGDFQLHRTSVGRGPICRDREAPKVLPAVQDSPRYDKEGALSCG